MSTSYSTTAYRLSNIAAIVRRANARVSSLAASFRHSLTPTHHAKQRARKLKLSVSIDAALGLDPKQISVIPLPVLETPPPAPSPAPVSVPEISRAVVGREREIRKLSRPVLRCDIPCDIVPGEDSAFSSVSTYSSVSPESAAPSVNVTAQAPVVLRGQNVPWRPVTSRWSMTTVDPSDAEEEDIVEVPRYSYTSEYHDSGEGEGEGEGSMDLPITVSPDADSGPTPYGELEYVLPHVRYPINSGRDTRRVERAPQHLVVPLRLDGSRLSWGSAASGSSSSSSRSGFSSSGSSSSAGSSSASSESSNASTDGPETPATSQPKLMIRIKRSIPADLHIAGEEEAHDALEKRPKYGRKPWAAPTRRTTARITTTMTMTTRSNNRF